MTITHDKEADAMYVYLTKEKVDHTIEISSDILLDIDRKGNPVGIEILAASEHTELIDSFQKSGAEKVPITLLSR